MNMLSCVASPSFYEPQPMMSCLYSALVINFHSHQLHECDNNCHQCYRKAQHRPARQIINLMCESWADGVRKQCQYNAEVNISTTLFFCTGIVLAHELPSLSNLNQCPSTTSIQCGVQGLQKCVPASVRLGESTTLPQFTLQLQYLYIYIEVFY